MQTVFYVITLLTVFIALFIQMYRVSRLEGELDMYRTRWETAQLKLNDLYKGMNEVYSEFLQKGQENDNE